MADKAEGSMASIDPPRHGRLRGLVAVQVVVVELRVERPQRKGGFSAPVSIKVGSGAPAIVVTDFNEDGRLDFATADSLADSASILLNTTGG